MVSLMDQFKVILSCKLPTNELIEVKLSRGNLKQLRYECNMNLIMGK